jgi:F-type H+-transporting ATPase subunit epsilon
MHLKILLPYQIFLDQSDVTRIVAETNEGSFGIRPHRLDCVAALMPGIFTYQTSQGSESYVAVDEGVLVKTGLEVLVSVRNAIAGKDLKQLHEAIERDFLNLDEQEKNDRLILAKLETGIVRRLVGFQNE